MIDLGGLSTEGRNPETMDLDTMSSLEIVEVKNREDARPSPLSPGCCRVSLRRQTGQ